MGSAPPLLSFLLMIAAGWVHRHQLIVIEFLQAENRLLKDRLRGRRIRRSGISRTDEAWDGRASCGRYAVPWPNTYLIIMQNETIKVSETDGSCPQRYRQMMGQFIAIRGLVEH
jgi:hypothetical protein